MLKQSSLDLLRGKKNLLAFSAGVDSSALFFLLKAENIDFDIAIVNYNTRAQSKDEVAYSKELASRYNLKCHLLNTPKQDSNFEAKAREVRYKFFENLIQIHNYNTLLTAHHLGDRFEWMMMQFCKGAGCVELVGMSQSEQRTNYLLIRPLLHLDKAELLDYLHENKFHYFEDESNEDKSILRNSFRHNYTKPLLEKHLNGIKKSFQYLDEDKALLSVKSELQFIGELCYFKSSKSIRADIITIDKYLKNKNYLITASERKLLQDSKSTVLGRKYLVSQIKNFIFIVPYIQMKNPMKKDFKEVCRVLEIDPKLRPYLYIHESIFLQVKELLSRS